MNVRGSRTVRDAALVVAALALFVWMALSAAAQKSPVFDEPPHIAAGAAVWLANDYRLLPESGVLVQRWQGLPHLIWPPQASAFAGRDWLRSDVWKVGDAFLYDSGNDPAALVRRARIMAVALTSLIGVVVFLWSRRIHGPIGGAISLTLFVFCPTMLAHGPLATADATVALFFIVATWAVWRLIHRISVGAIAFAACAVAALLLSKFSGPIIVAVAACLVVVRLIRSPSVRVASAANAWTIQGRLRVLGVFTATTAVTGGLVCALIWSAYGFRYRAFSTAGDESAFLASWSSVVDSPTTVGQALVWVRDHRLLPEAYVYGLAHTLKFSEARPAFLNGTFATTGNVAFFPYAFLVKSTLPLLLLALGGAVAAVGVGRGFPRRSAAVEGRSYSRDLVPVATLFAVYSLFALSSHLNIGHRYLLPLYPPLFILAGGVARWLELDTDAPPAAARRDRTHPSRSRRAAMPAASVPKHWRPIVGTAIALGLVWHAGESLAARPNYLAYMNEMAGSPDRRHEHLVDSSLDWGQDLPGLKGWLEAHSSEVTGRGRVYLSYFGSARPSAYRISAVMLPSLLDRHEPGTPEILHGGTYCVSATMLQGVYLSAPGPWTPSYEGQYQQLLHNVQAFEATAPNSPERATAEKAFGADGWSRLFQVFEQFRAARFFAFLRQRQPLANVGHSILIFAVSDEEAAQAQLGPAPL